MKLVVGLQPFASVRVTHHVKQVLSLSPITDDYHSYTNFKNIAIKHRNGLQASGGDSFEQLVTSLFEGLLPRNASPNSLLRILALLLSRPSWTLLTEESRTRRCSPTLQSVLLPLQIFFIVRHHPTTALASQSPERRIIQEPST